MIPLTKLSKPGNKLKHLMSIIYITHNTQYLIKYNNNNKLYHSNMQNGLDSLILQLSNVEINLSLSSLSFKMLIACFNVLSIDPLIVLIDNVIALLFISWASFFRRNLGRSEFIFLVRPFFWGKVGLHRIHEINYSTCIIVALRHYYFSIL